jgi:hypothetical protein
VLNTQPTAGSKQLETHHRYILVTAHFSQSGMSGVGIDVFPSTGGVLAVLVKRGGTEHPSGTLYEVSPPTGDPRQGLVAFETRSLLALLWAAAQSPIARRQLPTIIAGVTSALHGQGNDNGTLASPADIRIIVESVRSSQPDLERLEDFIPADPRHVVRWKIGDNRWRIDPGLIEDPIGIMKGLEIVSILDDEVVDALGFGVADLHEIALRHMDRQLSRLEESWAGASFDPLEPNAIAAAEFSLAMLTPPGSAQAEGEVELVLRACASPERARRALTFATVRADDLALSASPLSPLWGATLAIQIGSHRSFVPSSLVLEGLDATADRIAARLSRRRRYRERREDLAMARLGEGVRQLDADVVYPVESKGARPAIVVRAGERHVIVLDVVSGGALRRIERNAASAKYSLSSFQADALWSSPFGPIVVPPESEVMRCVVVDGPGRTIIDSAHRPLMIGLGDLCDIVGRSEDAVELWEFLKEVADPPRIGRMAAPGLPELWEVWTDHGTLNPSGLDVERAAVGWEVELERWNEAADWEPFDGVLAGAGLPSSAHSSRRTLDRPYSAQVWSLREPRHMRLIHVDPDLIVDVSLDDLGPLDPELVVNFGDAFLLATEQLPPFRAAIEACAPGLRIVLRANAEPPQRDDWSEDAAWVGVGGWVDPKPVIEFGCDYRLLVLMAHDAKAACAMIGGAIGQALKSFGVPDEVADDGTEAWRSWQAPFRTEFTENAPERPFQSARSIRPYDTARVHHDVAARLRKTELLPGTYEGDQAVQICDRYISPALLSLFVEESVTHDRMALLTLAANEVGAMHAERRRDALMLNSSMSTHWADERRFAASVGEDVTTKRMRASQLACELILGGLNGGSGPADRIDWAHLLAITGAILDISQLRAQSSFGLQPMELVIDEQHRVSILSTGETAIDLLRFDVFRRLLPMRPIDDEGQVDALENHQADEACFEMMRRMGNGGLCESMPFERVIEHPECSEDLRKVDRVMEQHLGTGIDGILAALKTAGSWDRDPQAEFAALTSGSLAEDAAAWSGLPVAVIQAAIGLLTLRAEDLCEEGNPYWLVEKRSFRLTTRPFMEIKPGTLWVIPELATAAQHVFARYFSDGRLPWPNVPSSVRLAMQQYRQTQNRRLEQIGEQVASEAGFVVRRGLTPAKAARMGVSIPSDVGEIDLLAADTKLRRLWVIEVKDPQEPFAPHELWSGGEEFRRRYAPRLRKKAQAVSAVMFELLRTLNIEPVGEWTAEPLFVTSRVELAAFDEELGVPFVVLDDLVELLGSRDHQATGLFVPGWALRVFANEADLT